MTPTETRAYAWLVRERGYASSDITFQYRTSPDFLTADGRGWEVKRLAGKVALFGLSQLAIFRLEPPTVLLWNRDTDIAPVAEVDFRELPMPGEWRDWSLRIIYQPYHAFPRPIHSAAELELALSEWLEDRKKLEPRYRRPLPGEAAA